MCFLTETSIFIWVYMYLFILLDNWHPLCILSYKINWYLVAYLLYMISMLQKRVAGDGWRKDEKNRHASSHLANIRLVSKVVGFINQNNIFQKNIITEAWINLRFIHKKKEGGNARNYQQTRINDHYDSTLQKCEKQNVET